MLLSATVNAETLKIVLSYAPGAGADSMARLIEKEMINRGRSVAVIYKPSGEGLLAVNEVLAAKPDGNTVLLAGTGPIIFKSMENEKNYSNMLKLVPVVRLADAPGIIVANPNLNVKTFKELVELSKKKSLNVGIVSAASRGIANTIFPKESNLVYIPYAGETHVANNLLNDTLDMAMGGTAGAYSSFIDANKMVPIAVTSPFTTREGKRVKTLKEQGVNFSSVIFFGIFLPPGTPDDIRDKLYYTIRTILDMPETKEAVTARGMTIPEQTTPDGFAKFIDADYKKWRKVIHD